MGSLSILISIAFTFQNKLSKNMEKVDSQPIRGRSRGRGRGEDKSSESTPGAPQPPLSFGGVDVAGVGRGRARGRGNRQESPAAAGRALLRAPVSAQPGQESVAALSSQLASTNMSPIAPESVSGEGAIQSRPLVVQRAILKTKPDSLLSKKGDNL